MKMEVAAPRCKMNKSFFVSFFQKEQEESASF